MNNSDVQASSQLKIIYLNKYDFGSPSETKQAIIKRNEQIQLYNCDSIIDGYKDNYECCYETGEDPIPNAIYVSLDTKASQPGIRDSIVQMYVSNDYTFKSELKADMHVQRQQTSQWSAQLVYLIDTTKQIKTK